MAGIFKIVVSAFLVAMLASAEGLNIVCYFGSWATYRPGDGKFDVENIDPNLCTHVIFGFAGLDEGTNTIKAMDDYNDLTENWGKGAYKRFVGLKSKNPNLKALIAIGGWNDGSEKYSIMASDSKKRAIFVKSALAFVQKHKFDGLDLDWEYPSQRGGAPSDKQNFATLIKELHAVFQPYNLLLTAATAINKDVIDQAYDIPAMSKYLNFINVMCYDYNGPWNKITGHNAPLRSSPLENAYLNVNATMNYYIQKGAAPAKLMLGMGSYGRSFTLVDKSINGMGAPAKEAGAPGPWTREAGNLGYNEICLKVKSGEAKVHWDPYAEAPYAVFGDQWVGYDNEKSIQIKSDLVKALGLGGGMVWSLETDDFRGSCNSKKFPLLSTMNEVLHGSSSPDAEPAADQESEVVAPIHPVDNVADEVQSDTSNSGSAIVGPAEGTTCSADFVRDPNDCSRFYRCINLNGKATTFPFTCQDGLVFDYNQLSCNWKALVPECN